MDNIIKIHPAYFYQLAKSVYKLDIKKESRHSLLTTAHPSPYNDLINVNRLFSTDPHMELYDRSMQVATPWKTKTIRPWQDPKEITLEEAVNSRVDYIASKQQRINILWSGGIDSTLVLTAFLRRPELRSQLRIIYTPMSVKEHPVMFAHLESLVDLEKHDISGTVYLDLDFDGVYVNGEGGDEVAASVDDSFYSEFADQLGNNYLDFFKSKGADIRTLEFAEHYFAYSSKPVKTVLEARWWFYLCAKLQDRTTTCYINKNGSVTMPIAFFDSHEIDSWSYYNTDNIIGSEYRTWKQPFKDYIFLYDNNADYKTHKEKFNSTQWPIYVKKQLLLNDNRWLFITDQLERVSLPALPFVSEHEWREIYRDRFDHMFQK